MADLGTHSPQPCDYPTIGYKVASAVAEGRFDRGVLLCKSGIGIAITANKVPGIRAAVCGDAFDAERSRSHNDANILVMGAEKLSARRAGDILRTWLATPFESGGRHERRVRQLRRSGATLLRRRHVYRVREADGEHELIALHLGAIAHALHLQLLAEPLADAGHHVGDQRAREAVPGAVPGLV